MGRSLSRSKCTHPRATWGGWRVTKTGRKHLKTCPDCGAHYTPDDGFNRMRYPGGIIAVAIDLYRQGLSCEKVSTFLLQHFQVKVSARTVLNWVNKYSKVLQEVLKETKPAVRGTVHLDEKLVKVKGKHQRYWGAKDARTKFRLASHLSRSAETKHAYRLFQRMIHGSTGRFRLLVSDKLGAYQRAFNKCFLGGARDPRRKGTRLNHGVPIACRKHGLKRNNNPIERDNPRIGRRVVLTRGFKDEESAWNILQLMDIGYNFLDPHWGLGGRTPAWAAGIRSCLDPNPLMGMIRASVVKTSAKANSP